MPASAARRARNGTGCVIGWSAGSAARFRRSPGRGHEHDAATGSGPGAPGPCPTPQGAGSSSTAQSARDDLPTRPPLQEVRLESSRDHIRRTSLHASTDLDYSARPSSSRSTRPLTLPTRQSGWILPERVFRLRVQAARSRLGDRRAPLLARCGCAVRSRRNRRGRRAHRRQARDPRAAHALPDPGDKRRHERTRHHGASLSAELG